MLDAPSDLSCRAEVDAEGRLVLGDVPVRARVLEAGERHVDLVVSGRPDAFDWHRDTRATFEYVVGWGICRMVGTARLIACDEAMDVHDRLVRLDTSRPAERILKRRYMRAALAVPVDLTADAGGSGRCSTVDVSAGGALLDGSLDLPVGEMLSFVLRLNRPITGTARVARFDGERMAIEFLSLTDEERAHLELAILERARQRDAD
jgi:hypothetical protein